MSVSVVSSSECLPYSFPRSYRSASSLEEVSAVEDSLQPFKQMIAKTDQLSVSLVCTVPTWSPSPRHCLDLHDLHNLRHRSIVFVHELLNLLRANGIQATHRLTPSNLDLATISISVNENSRHQVPIEHDVLDAAHASGSGKTLLARTEGGPVIIMT